MSSLLRSAILASFCTFSLWSCNNDDSVNGTTNTIDIATLDIPNDVTESEYVSLLSTMACATLGNCCPSWGYQYNETNCRAAYVALGNSDHGTNVVYDSAMATACLKAFQTAPPTCASTKIAACNDVYRGTLPLGASCSNSGECAPSGGLDTECEPSDNICTVTVEGKSGSTCDQTCMSELDSPGVAYCSTGMSSNEYPTANTHVSCARDNGLYCDTITNRCANLGTQGSACSGHMQCALGFFCRVTGSSGTCQPRVSIGQPCPNDAYQCATGSYCDATDNTCRAPKVAGASCSSTSECKGSCTDNICSDSTLTESLSTAFNVLFCGGNKL
jgi:hypothetical protein